MSTVLVVDDPKLWPLEVPDIPVISSRAYLTDPAWSEIRNARVFNLCRSYRYQGAGYYVSLLAVARGHVPIPSLRTMLDMRSRTILRIVDDDLEELIQKSLARLKSDEFDLSIYFGKNMAQRYERLCTRLFGQFHVPLLRAHFARTDGWHLTGIAPIPARRIPEAHRPFVIEAAREYFSRPKRRTPRSREYRYDLALLVNPEDQARPSDEGALKRFTRACEELGIRVERVTREDYSRLPEYDALFIRETTQVDHHTYRFAQRAEAEGLVVLDDPQSIIRCTNKVYLAELLTRRRIPIPKTVIGHRDNVETIADRVGLPCVLKYPDSSFSQGVLKASSEEQLVQLAEQILETSDLFVAQEWLPTDFDWRVGILDRKPLWISRYHMARGHWQIIKTDGSGKFRYGKTEPIPVESAPPKVLKTALAAANLIGDGLYGVDLKESGRRVVVIEVNDNPNIDSGFDDKILGMDLYRAIAGVFLQRIEARKASKNR